MEKTLGKECDHCKRNPSATKPFDKTRWFYIDEGVVDEAIEMAKKLRLPHPDCVFCKLMRQLINTPIDEVLKVLGDVENGKPRKANRI
jgi:hypothetical protein